MFGMLDAEYALILFDGDTKSYIAARDPIGIRPLYYGYDKDGAAIFASEAKNLVGLTDKIMPFPPDITIRTGNSSATAISLRFPLSVRMTRRRSAGTSTTSWWKASARDWTRTLPLASS